MINIINLTMHDINIVHENGEILTIPASGVVARCEEQEKIVRYINGNIPVFEKTLGNVINLPEEKSNTIYITSLIVAQAVKGIRNDIYVVNSSVRDSNGRIIGVRGLSKL